METFLTIYTPTYNRSYLLKQLWESLCRQTNRHFVWVGIDDGSTDDTKRMIMALKAQSDFPIEYVYKENGGKHSAGNYAVRIAHTPLFMCVDSDDKLMEEAVSIIKILGGRRG